MSAAINHPGKRRLRLPLSTDNDSTVALVPKRSSLALRVAIPYRSGAKIQRIHATTHSTSFADAPKLMFEITYDDSTRFVIEPLGNRLIWGVARRS